MTRWILDVCSSLARQLSVLSPRSAPTGPGPGSDRQAAVQPARLPPQTPENWRR